MRHERITGHTAEDVEKSRELLERFKAKGREFREGELQKNERELEFIGLSNSYLQQELDRLGVDMKADLHPAQVHVLEEDVFAKECGKGSEAVAGLFSRAQDAIFLRGGREHWKFCRNLMHESIHRTSFYGLSRTFGEEPSEFREMDRGGYQIVNEDAEKREFLGKGFNEAITEKLNRELLRARSSELIEKYGFPENSHIFVYNHERKILDGVIEEVAKVKNIPEEDVWDRIARGYFSGEMMHLRDIEDVFGKGSLRALFRLPIWDGSKQISAVYELAEEFLSAAPERRKKILANLQAMPEKPQDADVKE